MAQAATLTIAQVLLDTYHPLQIIPIVDVIILGHLKKDSIIFIAKRCLTDDQDGDKLKAFNLAFECWQAEKEKIRKERGRGLSHHHHYHHHHHQHRNHFLEMLRS